MSFPKQKLNSPSTFRHLRMAISDLCVQRLDEYCSVVRRRACVTRNMFKACVRQMFFPEQCVDQIFIRELQGGKKNQKELILDVISDG